MWLFFQQEKVALAQQIGRTEPAHAAADDHYIVARGNRRAREDLAISDLVANLVVFALHGGWLLALRGQKRKIHRAAGCN